MTRTVAVTGAAGALGRKTAEVLTQAGWNVVGIDLADGPFEKVDEQHPAAIRGARGAKVRHVACEQRQAFDRAVQIVGADDR